MVQGLKVQLDEYLQAGMTLLSGVGVDSSNVRTKSSPVNRLGTDMLNALRDYQDTTQASIAAKLDRLGLVGMICLIITGALGGLAVIAGLLISWRATSHHRALTQRGRHRHQQLGRGAHGRRLPGRRKCGRDSGLHE